VLAISDKKIIPWKTEKTEKLVCFGGIAAEFLLFRGTENSWNFVPNRSTEEKNARNSLL
jgi:hypothetical protein